MIRFEKNYRVRGLGLERFLDALRKEGVPAAHVVRSRERQLFLSVPLCRQADFERIAASLGFSPEALPARGPLLWLEKLQSSRVLILFLLLSCLLVGTALQFVWRVEITGAGMYRGEINRFLAEEGIRPGIRKSAVDSVWLSDALMSRLPTVAWVRGGLRGVTLRIDVTQGVPVPRGVLSDVPGDIVADRDGVVASIDVFSGTASVRPGDTVRAGDVLIRGAEPRAEGVSVPVRAAGRVTARVWLQAEASADAAMWCSAPTGRTAASRCLRTPWFCLTDAEEPDFLTYDTETQALPLGGAWFPLLLERRVCAEVALEAVPRDPEAARAEAGALAMRRLLILCGKNDEIIDKRLIFSMIEGDTVQATAVAELIATIGRFAPQTSD